jgi:hypothetical protein
MYAQKNKIKQNIFFIHADAIPICAEAIFVRADAQRKIKIKNKKIIFFGCPRGCTKK